MRYIVFLLVALMAAGSAKSQGFPGTDSLRGYNSRYITTNPATAFTNNRLNTLLRGIIDWVDTARAGTGGGGAVGVDTLYALNDSTIRFRRNGSWVNTILKGVYDTRRKVDTAYALNDTTLRITINGGVKDIILPGRPIVTYTNATGAGDTLLTASNTIKRIDSDNTITRSTNGSKILLSVDTTSWVASIPRLTDTARALRDYISNHSADSTIFSTNYRRDTAIAAIRQTYGKVYNVRDYGAVPDGVEKYTGAMTSGSPTLTCTSCSFSANDVGKSIRVEGAITNGDLVTTIDGFTNSTTVTLGANATRSVSNDTLVYGTDNTAAIQAAIDAAFAGGNGKVYVPGVHGGGFYVLAGPLITSFQGANPNAQLVWDVADLGSSTFNTRKHVIIEGDNPGYNVPSLLFGDTLTPKYGSVLYSIIDGSGTLPSVFGTKGANSGFGFFNYNEITFKNISIMVARNKYNGGPSVGGINGLYSGTTRTENVVIGIVGSINRQPQPSNDVAGLIVGKKDGEIYNSIKNTSVLCFKYGMVLTEGTTADLIRSHACKYGLTIITNNVPLNIGMFGASWCNYGVYVPNHTLFNLIPVGLSHFNIHTMHTEMLNGTSTLGMPNWIQYNWIVADSGSRGRGVIDAYVSAQAEVGLNQSLFNKYNGDSIFVRQMGSQVDPNPRSFTNQVGINNITTWGGRQNGGATGYWYNWSPFSDVTAFRAQPISGNASQGVYLSPFGTGSSSISPVKAFLNIFNTSFWTGVNTTSSNYELMQLASEGTQYSIKSIAAGTGTVRPINFQTGSNTGQLYLLSNGKVLINSTTDASTGILQVTSPLANISSFVSTANSNATVQFGAKSGFNINYQFMNGSNAVWYLQNDAGSSDAFTLRNSDANSNSARLTITQTGNATFAGDVNVPDEAYDATNWNGSLEVPTKNAVRDKFEAIGTGQNISNTSLTANGSYTQDWNHQPLTFNNINQWSYDSKETDGGLGTRKIRHSFVTTNNYLSDPMHLWTTIRTAADNADSLIFGFRNFFSGVDHYTGLITSNTISSETGEVIAGKRQATLSASRSGKSGTIGVNDGEVDIYASDSILIKGATPAASADSVFAGVINTDNERKLVFVPGPGYTVDAQMITAQNSGTSETDLYTKTIAANTLKTDKQTLNFEIDGEFNDNTATAQIKLYFGGNVTLNTGAINISTAFTAWRLKGYIIRTSSSTAHVTYELHCPGLATPVFVGYNNLTSLDFTTTNVFKITAQAGGAGGGNGDITAHSWQILYKPQP